MQKKSILFILVLLVSCASYAQRFMQSAGVNFLIMNAKIDNSSGKYSLTNAFTNLTYFPRYNILETDGSSVSIGAPVGAGIGISGGTGSGDASVYWGVDLPAVIHYNIGKKSTPDNDQNFGGYLGGGFGYTLTNWSDGSSTEKINSYGPMVRAGVRFGKFNDDSDVSICIGLSYKIGLETEKFKTYGIQVLMDF
jgi:hypothetical protein